MPKDIYRQTHIREEKVKSCHMAKDQENGLVKKALKKDQSMVFNAADCVAEKFARVYKVYRGEGFAKGRAGVLFLGGSGKIQRRPDDKAY